MERNLFIIAEYSRNQTRFEQNPEHKLENVILRNNKKTNIKTRKQENYFAPTRKKTYWLLYYQCLVAANKMII